jgi:hypothetical protein
MRTRAAGISPLATAVACFVVVLAMTQAASAATVRGRLVRYVNGGQYPAGGVAVTIYNQKAGRSKSVYTGPDGMYYLYNVSPGAYYIEIWTSPDTRVRPTVYPVQVGEPYTDVPVIVVPQK